MNNDRRFTLAGAWSLWWRLEGLSSFLQTSPEQEQPSPFLQLSRHLKPVVSTETCMGEGLSCPGLCPEHPRCRALCRKVLVVEAGVGTCSLGS